MRSRHRFEDGRCQLARSLKRIRIDRLVGRPEMTERLLCSHRAPTLGATNL
jgi:hypothetical protein